MVQEQVSEPTEVSESEAEPQEPPSPEQLQARVAELEALASTHEEAVKQAKAEADAEAQRKWEAHFQRVANQQVETAKKDAGELAHKDYVFRGLQNLALRKQQGDAEAAEQLTEALLDPDTASIWSWGHRTSQPADVRQAVSQAVVDTFTDIRNALQNHPRFKDIAADKHAELIGRPGDGRTPLDWLLGVVDAVAETEAEKRVQERLTENAEAVKTKVLEEEHAKAGGVAELKGGGPAHAKTKAQIEQAYISGDLDSNQYEEALKGLGSRP